ncbi:molybdopterin-dependent oxidoreductase [Nocardioides cynanchi]|uniref:molybdopterin-dependent oxidoreductase n=1 Tax=Nocardioides cynanchi TaxID=2558918 RepID=UPI0012470F73|nr:molybdopterin-dependent oxidoreductase [Nocardioides cynanchi]
MSRPADGADGGAPVGRRLALGLLGLGALGIVTGTRAQSALSSALAPVQLRDPTGLTSLLPVGDTFRYYSVTGGVPTRDGTSYRLDVGGLVDRPLTLTLDDLRALPQTELVRDFQCVTGWRVPQVHWSGVRLSTVLDRAGVKPTGQAVRLLSFDGTYTESLTLDQARLTDCIVALSMLGGPVSHDHGGPVRLYIAPMYGYKSIKWLSGIDVTDHVIEGYWEHRGYDVDGFVGASNGRSIDERT